MNRMNLLMGVSVLVLAGAAQAAWAQDTNDIIVTARRVEERLQDVPISITVFNQQALTNRNIVSSGDIAAYTPSLSANTRFGPEKTSFSIRGFNQDNGTAPSVGVYFADAPALRAQGNTTTGNGGGPGSFFDLQNLQVLKGPQGTLFGRNTSGGAILIVPQKPTGKYEGYIEASVGNYNLRRVQAVANLPILDTLRIRFGVDRQTRDGFMKNVSGIGASNFNDIDYWAGRFSVVADLTPNLENYFIATYSNSRTNGPLPRVIACDRTLANASNSATAEVTKLACNQVDRANNRDFYTGENAIAGGYEHIQSWQAINTTTWRATDTLTIKNIASYGEFRESLYGTVYGENLVITSGPNAGQNAIRSMSNPYQGRNNSGQSTFSEELQFQGTSFGDRLTWQGGLYYENSSPLGFTGSQSPNTAVCPQTNTFQCTGFVPSASVVPAGTGLTPSLFTTETKYYFQDYGIYAQGTYKLNNHFSVTGGIRYTRDNYQATTRQFLPTAIKNAAGLVTGFLSTGQCRDTLDFGPAAGRNESDCERSTRGHSQAPTWMVDIDYKPIDDILLYAKYARGYRQGQIKPDAFGREAFDPEKIDAYEIGVKTSWHGAIQGTLNIAGFYNDLSNQQIAASGNFVPVPAPGITPTAIQTVINAGKSRISGVEVDGSISPFHGLTFDVAYAYLDTKLISAPTSIPGDGVVFANFTPGGAFPGQPLTFSPKNKVTITGTYVLPLDESIGKISVGATFTHTDSFEASYTPFTCLTVGVGGNGIGNCARNTALTYDIGRIAANDLLNINVNWNSVAGFPVDLAFFATNVTKKKYYNAVFGGYSTFGFEGATVGEPRMYGVRLKYRFGA